MLIKKYQFNMIELVVAVAILAFVVSATLSISVKAKNDVIRSEERWQSQHYLKQAAEYYLLADIENPYIEDDILPEGIRSECNVTYKDENEAVKGWVLASYHIKIYDKNNELLIEESIDKLIRKDGL